MSKKGKWVCVNDKTVIWAEQAKKAKVVNLRSPEPASFTGSVHVGSLDPKEREAEHELTEVWWFWVLCHYLESKQATLYSTFLNRGAAK